LLAPDRHEVALHVANEPYRELEKLEKATNRKVRFYTVHGTARLLARLMWKRKLTESRASIPVAFPPQSFYEFPTLHFDRVCYENPSHQAIEIAEASIKKGEVLHVHPEWLFQCGTFNPRGPFYKPLKQILQVDMELALIVVQKRVFAKLARYVETKEYERDFIPTERFLEKLSERGLDMFTFLERKWCCPIINASKIWRRIEDNIALLKVKTYSDWLEQVGKKTRNMVRKATKSGIQTEVIEKDDRLVKGIWKIYNETPLRQGRAFPHYGKSLQAVKAIVYAEPNFTYVRAFFQEEMVGFLQLVFGDRIAIISQILSFQKHTDKAVNNALVAKAVEVCAEKQCGWLMYGRMGNHPSLDVFKENNGFTQFSLNRYYVPLTRKGRIAIRLGLHRELKDALPKQIKYPLIPIYNWISRTKILVKSRPKPTLIEFANSTRSRHTLVNSSQTSLISPRALCGEKLQGSSWQERKSGSSIRAI
jgi:hypothetical protein